MPVFIAGAVWALLAGEPCGRREVIVVAMISSSSMVELHRAKARTVSLLSVFFKADRNMLFV
ncbi:MAG: hypothetical protein EBU34_08345 [Alphaproteobacteria bacterium]|nr:hypothetical protein [Alphaproteobacteria bacterium]